MNLNSFSALRAFAAQLERHIVSEQFHTKVVITPSSVDEKGMVIKVSLLKSYIQTVPRAIHASRMLRVRLQVAGTAESLTGLEQALDAIEALDRYLVSPNLRLEAENEHGEIAGVPNSRIIQTISQEDSFIDSPDSTEVQDVEDSRIITITIPEESA
ncbi:MAG: hypothetical protein LBU16_10465 [Treponema sp.]|nr:hypothetical protein [Treponema sp.]